MRHAFAVLCSLHGGDERFLCGVAQTLVWRVGRTIVHLAAKVARCSGRLVGLVQLSALSLPPCALTSLHADPAGPFTASDNFYAMSGYGLTPGASAVQSASGYVLAPRAGKNGHDSCFVAQPLSVAYTHAKTPPPGPVVQH